MTLKFGLATPSNLWSLDWSQRQQTLSGIVASGFDHIFMADHVSFRDGSGTDGFVEVASLSQLNPDIGVMISIYLLPLRHPLPVARQLASMARIAPGRMIFGVGIGGEDRHELEVCGVDPKRRGVRANESLEIIKGLLSGDSVTFSGLEFAVADAVIKPKPRIPIPVLVGGRSDAALTRAAKFSEGWIGVWCSAKRFADAVDIVRDEAQAVGRSQVDWCHGYQPWVGVDLKSSKKAFDAVKQGMERFYHIPFEKFERYTPSGTPAEVAEQLAPYVKAGCRLFNLKICAEHPEEEVALGAEVIKHLRQYAPAKVA
ncbi:MAG: LLM class flavin-dependent oxidoreductase [Pseudomonadota bacterium]|nr:LLM class flavin-dependent oxidoreductase [Pseudomonadota bacterium]